LICLRHYEIQKAFKPNSFHFLEMRRKRGLIPFPFAKGGWASGGGGGMVQLRNEYIAFSCLQEFLFFH